MTVKELVQIITQKGAPPWSVRALLPYINHDVKELSLLNLTQAVAIGNAVIFIDVRNSELIWDSQDLAALLAKWDTVIPVKQTLADLTSVLAKFGCTAAGNLLTTDWKTVGIVGSIQNLTQITITQISDGNYNVIRDFGAAGAAGATTVGIAIAAATPVTPLVMGGLLLGGATTGGLTTLGISEAIKGDSSQQIEIDYIEETPFTAKFVVNKPLILGKVPNGMDPSNPQNWAPININSLPSKPGTGVHGGGGGGPGSECSDCSDCTHTDCSDCSHDCSDCSECVDDC